MTSDMPRPTYQDADLILRLYEMRREPRLREARRWFAAHFKARTLDEFHAICPPGSEPNASYRMLTTYWEMAASFVTGGALNRELFFQNSRELYYVWLRVCDVVPALRRAASSPVDLQNLETLARAYEEWWERQAPGAPAAYAKRVRG
jgi:hypothetical protein